MILSPNPNSLIFSSLERRKYFDGPYLIFFLISLLRLSPKPNERNNVFLFNSLISYFSTK
ncbi:hypothetical protein Lalb_Chr12g0205691 [Lupinus albus]|uniref:Uncharacterized protein n=1 Tax=Lupinus albus TaxID=3870 RepID=A0A6A4PNF8_LUPAL|nr:hypothetical protein Lalb_Chr12g0205691 [Lupinus albus]